MIPFFKDYRTETMIRKVLKAMPTYKKDIDITKAIIEDLDIILYKELKER
ncbi:hypothetical protein QCB49_11705 (plasmid) [Cetobacterium somerae]